MTQPNPPRTPNGLTPLLTLAIICATAVACVWLITR